MNKTLLNHIPEGYKSRISRKSLMLVTGLDERRLREAIAQLRREAIILSLDDGYFVPILPEENRFVIRWHRQETHRAKSIFWSMKAASDYVKEIEQCEV